MRSINSELYSEVGSEFKVQSPAEIWLDQRSAVPRGGRLANIETPLRPPAVSFGAALRGARQTAIAAT